MGIAERRQRECENRKNLVLATARKLFSQKGFANVKLDDIATEIEFSKGTIYSHFESKEEIYAHVLLEHLQSLLGFIKNAVQASGNSPQAIRDCLEVYVQFYNDHPKYFQMLFFVDLFSNHYRIPDRLLKEISIQKIACLAVLQKVLARGIKAGEIDAKYSPKEMALMLWGMINGILQLAESQQIKVNELDTLIRVSFDVVIKGMKGKPK
jgi:TetR/AcrR family transcriptional regulator